MKNAPKAGRVRQPEAPPTRVPAPKARVKNEQARKAQARAVHARDQASAPPPRAKVPARRRAPAPSPAGWSRRDLALIGGAAVLALGLVAGAVSLRSSDPAPVEPVAPALAPTAAAKPAASPLAAASPSSEDRAAEAVKKALALETDGRVEDALAVLDDALDSQRSFAAQGVLRDARRVIADRHHESRPVEVSRVREAAPLVVAAKPAVEKPAVEKPAVEKAAEPVAPVPPPAEPKTGTGPKPPVVSPVPVGEPEEPKRARTWMDDTDGGVPWIEAYTFETPHYLVKTNVKKEYAKKWAKILEALAERYTKIFGFTGNDFKYKKNEFHLYRTQQEFMDHEHQSEYVGGFYEPWSKRVVTFQGPWKGADEATTLSIVAHEATHQFENLVLREMDHAPTFVIEGLATFFEGTIVNEEGEVIVGKISPLRLKTMQRAIKAGEYVHLADLVRTSHANYSGFHYAHGWGLIHWMMYGPEAKKAQKLLDAYWDLCLTRPTTGDDFEVLLKAMGYTMDKLERSWKEWILALDPANDPAMKLYEKKTGKRVREN
jgi:hypothetical protein